MSKKTGSKNKGRTVVSKPKKSRMPIIIGVVILLILVISASAFFLTQRNTTSTVETSTQSNKPIILYVNQGNALVDASNYTGLLNFAKTNGFNTIFFQVYRSGSLLFSQSDLTYFAVTAHTENLKIFFALYFTATNQLDTDFDL